MTRRSSWARFRLWLLAEEDWQFDYAISEAEIRERIRRSADLTQHRHLLFFGFSARILGRKPFVAYIGEDDILLYARDRLIELIHGVDFVFSGRITSNEGGCRINGTYLRNCRINPYAAALYLTRYIICAAIFIAVPIVFFFLVRPTDGDVLVEFFLLFMGLSFLCGVLAICIWAWNAHLAMHTATRQAVYEFLSSLDRPRTTSTWFPVVRGGAR